MVELRSYALREQKTTSRLGLDDGMASLYTYHVSDGNKGVPSGLSEVVKKYFNDEENVELSKKHTNLSNRTDITYSSENGYNLQIIITDKSVTTRFDLPRNKVNKDVLDKNSLYRRLRLYDGLMDEIPDNGEHVYNSEDKMGEHK